MKINPDDFTEAAWQGIIDAKDLALTQNHQNLETEHLLYSLLKKNEIAIKVIERSGGTIKNLLKESIYYRCLNDFSRIIFKVIIS